MRDGNEMLIREFGEDFAGAVVTALAEKDRREQLGLAARRRAVETYGWRSIGRDLFAEYQRVAGNSIEVRN